MKNLRVFGLLGTVFHRLRHGNKWTHLGICRSTCCHLASHPAHIEPPQKALPLSARTGSVQPSHGLDRIALPVGRLGSTAHQTPQTQADISFPPLVVEVAAGVEEAEEAEAVVEVEAVVASFLAGIVLLQTPQIRPDRF